MKYWKHKPKIKKHGIFKAAQKLERNIQETLQNLLENCSGIAYQMMEQERERKANSTTDTAVVAIESADQIEC